MIPPTRSTHDNNPLGHRQPSPICGLGVGVTAHVYVEPLAQVGHIDELMRVGYTIRAGLITVLLVPFGKSVGLGILTVSSFVKS
ncbi:hypothetical protein ANO14919_136020 [Xylariales sp. No.14919]|nr:hypothetical protein ANO14919_136020 [Xylariales sp. No.14919]